jgi:four helix bundle protein
MSARFRFEKLTVWQEARALNVLVYRITRSFPSHEVYAMTSQIRRASVSVSSNIAEGAGRNSDRDFAPFLEQSYASLMEVASLFYLALDENYLSKVDFQLLLEKIESLAKQVAALNRSLSVINSKTPFARRVPNPTLDPRPSTLDR